MNDDEFETRVDLAVSPQFYYSACTDSENEAYMEKGQYLTVTGRVVKADPHTQELTLIVDGAKQVISFRDIYQIKDPENQLFEMGEESRCYECVNL